MPDTYWSTYVQTSEELYRSRALRFREDNRALWLDTIGVRGGMNILEVGCGGDIFCHRIKAACPDTTLTGLDFDEAHIAYATKKTAELGLDCAFVAGDACALPFAANTFDLCFSHTVMCFCDPDAFAAEQYRVLAANGRMVAMDVINVGSPGERLEPGENDAERVLLDRLWQAATQNENSRVNFHAVNRRRWAQAMEAAGFADISFDALAVMSYSPDSASTPRALAREQINEDRFGQLASVEKARRMAPEALTEDELTQLTGLINARYDERLAQYERGEHLWDFATSTVVAISGRKPA